MARCPCPHSLRPATAPRPRPLSTPLIPVRHDAGQWPDAPKPFGVIVPRLRVRVMARTWTWRRVEHRSSARRVSSRRRQPDPVSGSGRTVPGRSAASTHPGTRRHTSCRSVRARPAIPLLRRAADDAALRETGWGPTPVLRSGATALGVMDGAAIGRPVEERLARRGVAGYLCFSVVSAAVRRAACTRLRLRLDDPVALPAATPVCGCRGDGRSQPAAVEGAQEHHEQLVGRQPESVFVRILPGTARRQDVDSLGAERWQNRESDGKNQ